jgi:hypothetical protein
VTVGDAKRRGDAKRGTSPNTKKKLHKVFLVVNSISGYQK